MSIVERPNQEALSRAINIYLDAVRPFLTRNLNRVSGNTAGIAIKESLPPDKTSSFTRDLPKADNLESAIEASHVEHIIGYHWRIVFAPYFYNCNGTFKMLKCVAVARNEVSHPPYRRDLDSMVTREYLDTIAELVGIVGTCEERAAVTNIKAELESPGALKKKVTKDYERVKKLHQREVVAHCETRESAAKYRSERDLANGNLKKEETARIEAEKRAEDAEGSHRRICEELRGEVAARKVKEELVDKTETRLTRTENELEETSSILKKEKAARKIADKRKQGALASLCRVREELQEEAAARREAEETAQQEARGRQLAEETALALQTDLEQSRIELASVKSELERAEEQRRNTKKVEQENVAFSQHILNNKLHDPRTAQYELWLIDEILSGRLDRASLRQLVGDNRISGRLAYFVQAASSEMNGTAWNGYVNGRQKALLRNGKNRAFFADQQRRIVDQVPQH